MQEERKSNKLQVGAQHPAGSKNQNYRQPAGPWPQPQWLHRSASKQYTQVCLSRLGNQVLPGHGASQPVPLPYCVGCSNSNTCSHPSKTQTSLKPLVWTPSKRVTTGTVMLQRQAHRTQASQPGLEAMGRSLKGNDRQRHKHAVSAHACVAAGQQTVLRPRNTGSLWGCVFGRAAFPLAHTVTLVKRQQNMDRRARQPASAGMHVCPAHRSWPHRPDHSRCWFVWPRSRNDELQQPSNISMLAYTLNRKPVLPSTKSASASLGLQCSQQEKRWSANRKQKAMLETESYTGLSAVNASCARMSHSSL